MRVIRCSAITLALVVGAVGVGQSQSGAPTLVQVTTSVIKPALVADYEEYVKKIGAAAAKVGQPQRASVYQVTLGTRNFTYITAVRLANWAGLDALMTPAEILAKAYGDVEAARIMKAGRSAVETTHIELHRYLPDLSTNFKVSESIPAFAQMIRTQLKPDGGAAYTEYLTKLKAAQEQTPNHPTAIRMTSVQGRALLYTTVQYYNKFAERDSWPNPADVLRKSLGEADARRVTENSNRGIESRETWVLRYRADLSRGGARTTSH